MNVRATLSRLIRCAAMAEHELAFGTCSPVARDQILVELSGCLGEARALLKEIDGGGGPTGLPGPTGPTGRIIHL